MVKSGGKWWLCMFIGEYNHTIDAKGRLIIPSKFRELLSDEFMVTRGLDGCLFVYNLETWEKVKKSIAELPVSNKESRKYSRFFLGRAAAVELDKQGRILIPGTLREFAKLDKDIVLLGVGDRIEIWNKEILDMDTDDEDMESIAEHIYELGLG